MRVFSYRNRMRLRRAGVVLLTAAIVLLVLAAGFIAYFDRYIVYDRDGAHVEKEQTLSAAPEVTKSTVEAEISYVSPESDVPIGSTRRISGLYVSWDMLKEPDVIRQKVKDSGCYAVMLEVKEHFGYCYYPSQRADAHLSDEVDTEEVGRLIDELKRSGIYLIAKLASFSDYYYAAAYPEQGLHLSSGAVWADSQNCYWLDPGSPGVYSYLESICLELAGLGFREIVFDDFEFPESPYIVYDEELRTKDEILAGLARDLTASLQTEDVKVSFLLSAPEAFVTQLVDGRLYAELSEASQIAPAVKAMSESVVDPEAQLVFLTASRDTRFDDRGCLRPAIAPDIPDEDERNG